jgi:transglycosylase-like protein with SLT domain
MIRPIWRCTRLAAVCGIVSLSILAGCTNPSRIRATDETARYLQNARGRYTIPGTRQDPWGPYIREASQRFDVPERWIRALMRQESGGNLYRSGRLITSSAGAMGLMQVMPGTYDELRSRHSLGPDPFDPHDNIMAGVAYMREMYDIYGSPGFLAAYNAGPNRMDDYLANQRGLPDETRQYVAAIGPSLRSASPRVRSSAEQYAINQLPLNIPPGPRYGYGTSQVSAVRVAATYQQQPLRATSVAFTTPSPVRQASVLARSERSTQYVRRAAAEYAGSSTRVAVNRSGRRDGVRLISTAAAAEVSPPYHRHTQRVRVSYGNAASTRAHGSGGPRWHVAAGCHPTRHKDSSCSAGRQAKK